DQYAVGKIRLEGNTLFGEDEIRQAMLTDRGQVFNQSQFVKDLETVRDLYRDQGYILAQIQPRLDKDEQNDVVDVTLSISEGYLIFLGNVIVQGVTTFDDGTREAIGLKTRDHVILREIRMSWDERIAWKKVGSDPSVYEQKDDVAQEREEPYVLDWGEVKKSKRRLENLGFFKKDRVEFEPQLTEDPEMMDLLVRLEEQHTGNISFGAGFSTEYGASLFFGLSEKNLFGRGQALDLSGEIGSRRQSFRIGFTEPYLFDSDYSFGADLYNTTIERFSGRDFQENRKGGSIRIGRQFWEHYTWYVRLKHEAVKLDDVFYGGGRVVTEEMPPEYEELSTKVNSLTLTLVKDTRDLFQAPTKGYKNLVSLEQAGFGGTPFTKVKAETSWYTKLTQKMVLAVNGELGAIGEFSDEIPLSERFFLGGAETVRGYEYGTISPVDFISYWRDDHGLYLDRRDVRVGGEEMMLLKTEVRYPITDIIEGVVFVDAGGTWRELGDFDTGVIRYSTGLGLRIQLPIGAMIRLDYGHALNPDEYQDTQPIHFSFGHSF
ncbi:MAG TPA: BamA/TamA family outer membrane protein, partial [bacterium]|nr:BamA/TamA family outer membrane protein [bacterium]